MSEPISGFTPTPTLNPEGGVVTYSINIAGQSLQDTIQVKAISIERSVNRIASAKIELVDGDPAARSFFATTSSTFNPGGNISIAVGYDGNDTTVFEGEITGIRITQDEAGAMAEVQCKDCAVAMTIVRNSQTFTNTSDTDIFQTLIGNYSKLSGKVQTSAGQEPVQQPLMQQYDTSDWDFMLTRAEANGLVVATINNVLNVFSPLDPDIANNPALSLDFGEDLLSSDLNLNSITQFNQVTANSWDYSQQALNSSSAQNTDIDATEAEPSTELAEVFSANVELQSSAMLSQEELAAWSQAQMLKSELNRLTGEIAFPGIAAVEVGQYLNIGGLGNDIDGNQFVAGIRHEVQDGDWITHCTLGLDINWFAAEPDVMTPPAAGLLPGIQGLFNGTVAQVYDDPTGEYRVLVNIPLFNTGSAAQGDEAGEESGAEAETEGDSADMGNAVWARIANFYSSSGIGALFLPEVGDEVILGFVNDDPRNPIILGSLYSSKRAPFPYLTPAENNPKKGIVTASNLRILFDDADKALSIITPNNNLVILDDSKQKITVQDQHNNLLVMSQNGIDLNSPGTVNIQAQEKINIVANQGVFIEAGATVGDGGTENAPGDDAAGASQDDGQSDLSDSSGENGSTKVLLPAAAPSDSAASEAVSATIKAPEVNINASENMTASADGEATVSGGGELTLKADLVAIN